ncbi:2-keto-3-deoxygluconate permease [Anaerococcus porci]|uniref:2-keto-3-deoxygluconate permease n=1 Tax=Anaerococcus porci TaxID=2652269 RepID=UPI002A74DE51|nr:2-keto-3-deoxygluconate permease [Anaerococcus porci]MDY3005732.1 2-keto-3-deoxygluconate permease [Anaerococcus porci]
MIEKLFKKIPAGNMMIPLFITAILNSFFPNLFTIGKFSKHLFTTEGMVGLMALNLTISGTGLRFENLATAVKRTGIISIARVFIGVVIVFLVSKFFGKEGIFGISILALVCGTLNHNNSVFISLNLEYGDEIDNAGTGIAGLITGPFLALLIFGSSGMANISVLNIIDSIVPLIFGMIIGNIDHEFGENLRKCQKYIIVFLGLSMGAGINIFDIFKGGLSGILLGVIVVFIMGSFTVFIDMKINKRRGHSAWAISTTGANAIAVPAIIGSIDKTWMPFVEIATAQVAASVIFTIIVIPLITSCWANKYEQA